MPNIVAFAEQKEGKLRKGAFETTCEARRLVDALGGGEVVAIVLGSGVTDAAAELGQYGADKVLVIDHADLGSYSNETYLNPLVAAVQSVSPYAVIFNSSAIGRELSPMLAAKLDVGVVADCTGIEVDGDNLVFTRPIFAGKAFAEVCLSSTPKVFSLRPNSVSVGTDNARTADVSAFEAEIPAPTCTITKVEESGSGKLDLTEAEIIVSGGRGMKGPENFNILEELAGEIGAVVGASRAVVDAGWRPHADQVGQTGKTVSPKLYIACGISGAIQHLAGMSSSKCIVAVNKDPEAPIFKVAHYGIVGDLFEVVPALTGLVKEKKG